MTLVDTSIWIDHFRTGEGPLVTLLSTNLVYTHPFVIGELACGNLSRRQETIDLLSALPTLGMAQEKEVYFFIEKHSIMGRGIGYIDAHLLAASALHACKLLTRDKRLKQIAEELTLAYQYAAH